VRTNNENTLATYPRRVGNELCWLISWITFTLTRFELVWLIHNDPTIEFPPMQAPASFNLEAVKREIDEKIKQHEGD
jgi:hypothetical protein